MDAQAPALPSNLTAREAAKRIRRDKPNPDAMPLRIVCVVDSDQRIEGVIDIDRLLRAGPRETLAQLMDRKTPSLSSRESLRAARDSPGWSERSALPVLNRQGRLVGVLHHAVLTRALHQESTQFQAKPHQDAALDLAGVYWMGVTALLQGGISYFTQAELKATPKVKRT
jgi:Mg/Co/Ni transporter MgtE